MKKTVLRGCEKLWDAISYFSSQLSIKKKQLCMCVTFSPNIPKEFRKILFTVKNPPEYQLRGTAARAASYFSYWRLVLNYNC